MNCENCYWNFDGFCAYHGGYDFDVYGHKVEELIKLYPEGCCDFDNVLTCGMVDQVKDE